MDTFSSISISIVLQLSSCADEKQVSRLVKTLICSYCCSLAQISPRMIQMHFRHQAQLCGGSSSIFLRGFERFVQSLMKSLYNNQTRFLSKTIQLCLLRQLVRHLQPNQCNCQRDILPCYYCLYCLKSRSSIQATDRRIQQTRD